MIVMIVVKFRFFWILMSIVKIMMLLVVWHSVLRRVARFPFLVHREMLNVVMSFGVMFSLNHVLVERYLVQTQIVRVHPVRVVIVQGDVFAKEIVQRIKHSKSARLLLDLRNVKRHIDGQADTLVVRVQCLKFHVEADRLKILFIVAGNIDPLGGVLNFDGGRRAALAMERCLVDDKDLTEPGQYGPAERLNNYESIANVFGGLVVNFVKCWRILC